MDLCYFPAEAGSDSIPCFSEVESDVPRDPEVIESNADAVRASVTQVH